MRLDPKEHVPFRPAVPSYSAVPEPFELSTQVVRVFADQRVTTNTKVVEGQVVSAERSTYSLFVAFEAAVEVQPGNGARDLGRFLDQCVYWVLLSRDAGRRWPVHSQLPLATGLELVMPTGEPVSALVPEGWASSRLTWRPADEYVAGREVWLSRTY